MNHTPGPWKVKQHGEDFPCVEVAPCRHITIEGNSYGEVIANAALIAAAPDLLAACKSVMEFLSNGTPVRPGALVQAEVFNAIRKAEAK